MKCCHVVSAARCERDGGAVGPRWPRRHPLLLALVFQLILYRHSFGAGGGFGGITGVIGVVGLAPHGAIVTNSSAAVGCIAIAWSKSDLVAPILRVTAKPCEVHPR